MKYSPRTTAMAHQRLAIEAAANKPSKPSAEDVFAYLMDMGTGKSKVVLDEFGEMATSGGPQDLLVVAPAGSYRNWFVDKSDLQLSELNTHMDPEFRERLVDVGWETGGGANWKRRVEAMLRVRDRPRALFVNVEALSTVKRCRELCMEFLQQRLAYMAVDESTTIKSPRAQRTKFVHKMGEEAAVRRILTGLIAPRSPLDIYSQFEFLDWRILGLRSYYAFRARYAIMKKMTAGGRTFDVVVGYRNIEDLQERIRPYSYRVLKSECLDLEPKVYTMREVELTTEQRRVYTELKGNAHAILQSGAVVSVDSVIKLIMRLHQVNLGYVVDEDGDFHELPEKRTDALVQVLDEHAGKVIIWTPFVPPLLKIVDRLKAEFGPKSVAAFWGGNKKERGDEERRFLGDPECRYMVATQGAGMRGNTWTVADLVVYYANNHDLEQRDQSEDRAHRKGQVNRVTYVDLVVPGSVDTKILKSLRQKINMATTITGENYREWLI